MLNGYIEIESFNSSFEAEMALNLLKDAGIEALIDKDDCGGMMPNLQFVQGVKLCVLPRDIEKSRLMLKALSDSTDTETTVEMWTCKKCGTDVEPQFTDCWNCGTARA